MLCLSCRPENVAKIEGYEKERCVSLCKFIRALKKRLSETAKSTITLVCMQFQLFLDIFWAKIKLII